MIFLLTISWLLEVDISVAKTAPSHHITTHSDAENRSGSGELLKQHGFRDVWVKITHVQRRHRIRGACGIHFLSKTAKYQHTYIFSVFKKLYVFGKLYIFLECMDYAMNIQLTYHSSIQLLSENLFTITKTILALDKCSEKGSFQIVKVPVRFTYAEKTTHSIR